MATEHDGGGDVWQSSSARRDAVAMVPARAVAEARDALELAANELEAIAFVAEHPELRARLFALSERCERARGPLLTFGRATPPGPCCDTCGAPGPGIRARDDLGRELERCAMLGCPGAVR